LLAAHLSVKIERCFKKHLPVSAIFQAPTIKQQSSLLDGDASAPKYTTLAALQAHGSLKPFFWAFTSWAISEAQKFLDSDQPLYFLHHQSQDGAPTTHKNVEAFAHHYLREIRQVQPRGPYFLGGFSFGGILVYEIASQLRRAGEEVALLFLLDPTEPVLRPESNTAKHRGILKRLQKRNWQKESLKVWILRNVSGMITNKSTRKFICNACIKHKRPIPVVLRTEYIINIYRDAIRRYRPAPYKGHTLMISSSSALREPGNNWYIENTKDIRVCELQGDHDNIVKKPLSKIWAQKLKEELEQSQSGRFGEL
jgi:thioesterase domain-containing protein